MASKYFLAVRDVVNAEDPIGLLDLGAPVDEYDPEVRDLVKQASSITAQRVHEIFQRWFDEANDLSIEGADRIATEINRIQAELRTD